MEEQKILIINCASKDQQVSGELAIILEINSQGQKSFFKTWKFKKWFQFDHHELMGLNQLINQHPNLVEKFANLHPQSYFNQWIFSCDDHYLEAPFNYLQLKTRSADHQGQKINLKTFLKLVPESKYWFKKQLIAYEQRIDHQSDFQLNNLIKKTDQDDNFYRQCYRKEINEAIAKQKLIKANDQLENAHIINFAKLIRAGNYDDAVNPYNCLFLPKKIHHQWDQKQIILLPNGTFVDDQNQIVYKLDLTKVAKPTWQYLKKYWQTYGLQLVRTRYAPSPTGGLHIGGARTALFNYLFAKHHQGQFIFRLEDSDQQRNIDTGEKIQLDGLKWLNINIDESPLKPHPWYGKYRQSEKLNRYQAVLEQLLKANHAYYAFDTKEELEQQKLAQAAKGIYSFRYDPNWLKISDQEKQHRFDHHQYCVRLRLPKKQIYQWNDLVRGPISFNSDEIGDWILVKADGYPTYNFAVVVDDHDMEISHVFRGEEHISNTPKQLILYDLLNWEAPQFGHLSIITNDKGKKLSKRDDQALMQAISDYQNNGYHPDAIVNFLALLGWKPVANQEIFTLQQLENEFDYQRLAKAPTQFDLNKLNWFAKYYFQTWKPKQLLKDLKWNPIIKDQDHKLALIEAYQCQSKSLLELQNHIDQYLTNWSKPVQKYQWEKANIEILEKLMELNNRQFKITTFRKWLKPIDKKMWKTIRIICTSSNQGPELAIAMWFEGRERWKKRFPMINWKA